MINLISFFFYNLSNLIFIILIPEYYIKSYLINFSLGSGLFTALVFFNFVERQFINEKLLVIFGIIFLIIINFLNLYDILIWLYAFLIIFSDYFFSQRYQKSLNFFFKTILLLTSILVYFEKIFSVYDVINIKISTILFFISIYQFFENQKFIKLKVKSSVKYNIITSLIYFGSLFFISIFIENIMVKYFYLMFQIGLGVKLKFFDLNIRGIKTQFLNLNFERTFDIAFSIAAVLFSIYFSEYIVIVIFILANFILNNVKKKYIS